VALDQSALLELLEMMRSADEGELMRRLLGTILQELVDAEATALIGAEPHQRTEDRTTQRNGSRDKTVTTGAGDLTIKIPKVRTGSFFPALLAPRRRIDVALHAVVMQAYVEGVSTRRVDDLVIAMGGTGISKSEVSRICGKLDAEVAAWRARSLDEQAFPYVFLDATYCKSASTSEWCPRPWSSPPASAPMAEGKCSAAPPVTARPRRSGPSSCATCAIAA
jgi:putative transposase